jgi:tetratricopeptide (TPR) repeat protein
MPRSRTTLALVAASLLLTGLPGRAQTEARQSVESYQHTIAELQAQPNDAQVDVRLSEAWSGLGNALQAMERHEDAVDAFGQAMQLLRENNGLYAIEQLPLIHARLTSNLALSAWEEVDTDRQLAYQLAVRNPDVSVAVRYQSLRELGLWKLRAADEDLIPNSLAAAKDAAELYRHELEQPGLRAAYQGKGLWLANLYLDLAAVEFMQAKKKLALPLSAFKDVTERNVTETYCETIVSPDGRSRQVCRNLTVPNMDYFMSLTDKKYRATWEHLDAMQDAVLEAYKILLPEVDTANRDDALMLLADVHRLTGAFNDFVAKNARRTGTHITASTSTRIRN